jgi:hypothetical protein
MPDARNGLRHLSGPMMLWGCTAANLSRQRLAELADDANIALWKVLPKHHYLMHVFLKVTTERVNPRKVTNFMDEDFLGKISRLGKSVSAKTASLRILQRYLLYELMLNIPLPIRWPRQLRDVF